MGTDSGLVGVRAVDGLRLGVASFGHGLDRVIHLFGILIIAVGREAADVTRKLGYDDGDGYLTPIRHMQSRVVGPKAGVLESPAQLTVRPDLSAPLPQKWGGECSRALQAKEICRSGMT